MVTNTEYEASKITISGESTFDGSIRNSSTSFIGSQINVGTVEEARDIILKSKASNKEAKTCTHSELYFAASILKNDNFYRFGTTFYKIYKIWKYIKSLNLPICI